MKRSYPLAILGVALFLALPQVVHAEEAQAANDAVLSQVEQLENLRQSNPQAYRQMIDQRKAALRQAIQQMGGEREARFQQFLAQNQKNRFQRLQNFRQQHPQAFQNFMNRRMERLRTMAERNPQRFEKFLANHPRVQERLAAQGLRPQNQFTPAATRLLRPEQGGSERSPGPTGTRNDWRPDQAGAGRSPGPAGTRNDWRPEQAGPRPQAVRGGAQEGRSQIRPGAQPRGRGGQPLRGGGPRSGRGRR